MGLSFMHLLVVLIVVLIVFGAGRLPQVMGDLGKGIRNFKAGLNGDASDQANKVARKDEDETKNLPPSSGSGSDPHV